jgi:hypothetical protein
MFNHFLPMAIDGLFHLMVEKNPFGHPMGKTVLLKRQHFLLLRPVSNVQTASRLKVVKNWLEEVKRLAPAE